MILNLTLVQLVALALAQYICTPSGVILDESLKSAQQTLSHQA